ncbi:laminin subunit alpha-like isoform X3, partial [Biomphalaria glabrata]
CHPPWYGRKCLQHCNCQNQASCPSCDYSCIPGYFTKDCQYSDVMQENSTTVRGPSGNYESYTQGLIRGMDTSPLEINFNHETFFTWMTLCFETNVPIEYASFSLNVSTSLKLNVDPDTNCGEVSKLFLNESHCVVLRCEPYLLVTKVFVYWQGKIQLRSLNVSGGANMALKQDVRLDVKSKDPNRNPSYVVDQDYGTTATSQHKTRLPVFHVILREAIWIQRIVLVTASKEVHNLSVQVFDDLSKATDADYSYLVATEHDNNFFHSFYVPSRKRSKKIKVTGVNNIKQRSLSFADILIYSDCLFPFYGPTCEDSCSIGCEDMTCYVTGECFSCMSGMTGKLCLEFDPSIDEGNEEEFVPENIPKTPFSDHAARKSESLFAGTDLFFAILFGAVILVILLMLAFYILINIAVARSESSFSRKSQITTSFTSTIKHNSVGSTRVSSGPYSTKRVSLASTVNGPQEGQTREPDKQSKAM